MDTSRIAELLQPFLEVPLSVGGSRASGSFSPSSVAAPFSEAAETSRGIVRQGQLQCISIYIDMLSRWNARVNLTAVRLPEDIVTRHFGESLFAARHLFPGTAEGASKPEGTSRPIRVFDVGSGAGFPGLPIKIWAPDIELTLIESNQKKATFLREVVRALALTDVSVYAGRSEELVKEAGSSADLVTLRAVERFDTAMPVAAALVRSGGRMALLIGASQLDRVGRLSGDFAWGSPLKVPLSDARALLVGSKQ